ncbi:DUF302 domain-containing protein [Vibrio pomeroyi]|uniref:DUF302 domain-containing protein n=2 Tax=Vibrio TaxID=662 RepID=A0ABV4MUN9_9VIBR|nr:DUF302 domain-containing protein [Vibrio sp. ED004]UPR56525.1 DUF302 domain-containing protein [Vibrio sp. ED004]UPR56585.1 DUF302 domain-containing protein [Vibrio sp. ED004]
MKKLLPLCAILLSASFSVAASDGLIKYQSNYSVKETADRFEEIAKSKGLTLFARIDHQKNASNVDLELRPTEVIIFGNPKVGTPLMQCAQEVAIDLPQKVLVSEDANKKVWLSYNDPNYLLNRHAINGCDEVIKKISSVLSKLSEATIAKK